MPSLYSLTFFLLFCISGLFCETISTFYGPLTIEEPILLELIHSPAFQRLKDIHQYGVCYYTKTHPEEYTRFAHSLGVFAILRSNRATLEEQISGLLHDISHTAFSHVGDWVFSKEHKEDDYQTTIHNSYLASSGIEEILNRHGYTVEEVSPKRDAFTMLEAPLPNLCADRIDYNIQGAYFQKFLTAEEAQKLFHDIYFEEGKWVITDLELAAKLTNFSLFMTEDCWTSALNCLTSRWLADAILRAIEIGTISWDQFKYGIDQDIWDRLSSAQDPLILNRMKMLQSPDQYFCLVDPGHTEHFLKFKSRGIDPWVKQEGQTVRLTSIRKDIEKEFLRVQKQSIDGWPVQILIPAQNTFD